MRLIDANALEEILEDRLSKLRTRYGDYDQYTEGFEGATKFVEFAPTLTRDDLVQHGAWITQNSGYTKFQCSACGSKNHDICWPFCCKCGAKMDLPHVRYGEKMDKETDHETD